MQSQELIKITIKEEYCKFCGTQLEERDTYCPECGSLVSWRSIPEMEGCSR